MALKNKIQHLLKNSSGFTFIEAIVSLGVLSLLTGLGVSIFLVITQAYAKASIINKLRSEGSRVMEDLGRIVRSSSSVSDGGDLLTVLLDTNSLEYADNGQCREVVFTWEKPAEGEEFNQRIRQTLNDCDSSPVGEGVITDEDLVSGVNVSNFEVTITPGGGNYPDRIDFLLVLEQAIHAPNRQRNKASVTLRSSVTTRNY